MSEIEKLKEKRDYYYQELEDLHLYEPSEEWYKMRRYEVESQIAFIEDAIDQLEREKVSISTHLKVIMLATVIIVGTAVLIILLWS